MKNGGDHWQWDPTIPFYIGVLPRRGAKGTDVKVRSLKRTYVYPVVHI